MCLLKKNIKRSLFCFCMSFIISILIFIVGEMTDNLSCLDLSVFPIVTNLFSLLCFHYIHKLLIVLPLDEMGEYTFQCNTCVLQKRIKAILRVIFLVNFLQYIFHFYFITLRNTYSDEIRTLFTYILFLLYFINICVFGIRYIDSDMIYRD